MSGEDGVNFRSEERGDHNGLAVEMTPFVESPEPHSRKVHSMSLSWLQVEVVQNVLWSRR